jgi:hypothetical protein
MVQSTEHFRMDAKAEKLALFRYGLIAPLVLEALPRGELTRRAEEIASRLYDINAGRFPSIHSSTGQRAIETAGSRLWRRRSVRTVASRAPSLHNWPA